MQLIVLANSYKNGGRCLAGIDCETGRWIRPITDENHGALDLRRCIIDVNGRLRTVQCLDVIEVKVGLPKPQVAQPENHELLDGKFKWLATFDRQPSIDFLEALKEKSDELLFNTDTKVNEIYGNRVLKSLTLIKVEDPLFFLGLREGKSPQLRTKFAYKGTSYDLPITDDRDWTNYARVEPERFSKGTWYFTISLGELWNGSRWKLVAGCMSKDLLMK
jgi:hypothetical protein